MVEVVVDVRSDMNGLVASHKDSRNPPGKITTDWISLTTVAIIIGEVQDTRPSSSVASAPGVDLQVKGDTESLAPGWNGVNEVVVSWNNLLLTLL